MPDDVKLLPCPFCGGTEHEIGVGDAGHDVYCHSFACRASTGAWPSRSEAIAAWNRRTLPSLPSDIDGVVEELERGLEGTSDGPWHTHRRSYDIVVRNDDHYLLRTEQWGRLEPADAAQMKANAEHVARCSPDNIRKLIAALRTRQAPEGVVEAASLDAIASSYPGDPDGTIRAEIGECILAEDAAVDAGHKGLSAARQLYVSKDDVRVILRAALLAMPSGAGWQPIDTAPKDETLILAACLPDRDFPTGRIMVWRSEFLADVQDCSTPDHLQFHATHWMPLPALPADQPS